MSFYRGLPPWLKFVYLLAAVLLLAGCENNMRNQPRYKPLAASDFFPDSRSARPLVDGTVPREQPAEAGPFYTGRSADGELLATMPFSVTLTILERGQERFDIYCSPCHGRDGYGQGMIVQRGFPAPPSYHTDRLRAAPDGHFFDVITNGFGRMYSYGYRVSPEDRWAIVAYIRALQVSQHASTSLVPEEEMQKLEGSSP